MELSSKQDYFDFNFQPAKDIRFQAQAGYKVLASLAAVQVPELAVLVTNSSFTQVRHCAASALGYIGEEAKSAAPALLISAADPEDQVRNSSLWALSRINADIELVLPGLIKGLDDSFSVARENATLALKRYGPLATNAVPALLRRATTNSLARSALLEINPEVLSEVERE